MSEKELQIAAAYLFDHDADTVSVAKKFGVDRRDVWAVLRQLNVDIEATRQQRLARVYRKMRLLRSIGYSQARIANETGYSVSMVRKIVGGDRWAA